MQAYYNITAVKMTVLFLVTLLTFKDIYFCYGMAINLSNTGGSIQEDPAPGRSPGPPEVVTSTLRRSSELPTILLTSERADANCALDGNIETAQNDDISVVITHSLFKTDLLVPGVTYQVKIKPQKEGLLLEFTISSFSSEGIPTGSFLGIKSHQCEPHTIKSQLNFEELTFNWTVGIDQDLMNSNITFKINYKIRGSPFIQQITYERPFSRECQLWLEHEEATLSWKVFPSLNDCQVWFPMHGTGHGLVVEITRLNVACSRGYLHFSGLNITQHQHFRSHKQAHLCGKLEELPEADRHIYFPSSHTPPFVHLHGSPIFMMKYHLVDYCYNVTFVTKNGSYELKPSGELQCTFKIYLPYGNRVALSLHIGDSTSTGIPETNSNDIINNSNTNIVISHSNNKCEGLLTQLFDGDNKWSHCTRHGDADRRIEIVSKENKVVLKVSVRSSTGALGMRLYYRAEPVEEIVGICGFGWIALRQFCVSAIEGTRLPWAQAEMECVRRGGHLASIRSQHAQNVVDNLLFNSPGYKTHNAYWIGATDKTHEGDFRWSDGLPFSYTNWFPGWAQHGHYNKQPNDDGLSEQDCVEVRRIYALPASSASLATTFMWNDRDCSTPNYFICERLQSNEPLEDSWPMDCNRTVILTRQQPRVAVSSPGFPRQYPDNALCVTDVTAPPGYRIVLDFEELVLESEPTCSYDYLEIVENSRNISSLNDSNSGRRLCGDWSSKLKLLRYVSNGSRIKLRFSSDYSHHYGGFKARASMENVLQCSDDRLQMFNNSCYLFVSYPEVTWSTAQQICNGIKADLASILTAEEERFITLNIRKTSEYRTSALYWLGARANQNQELKWIDGNQMEYFGWLPVEKYLEDNNENDVCLGIQWMPSPTPMIPSGLYWKSNKCSTVGGYVCKQRNQDSMLGINFNRTINGTEGNLTTPNYPENYYNNLDFSVKIFGPDRTRLVIIFHRIDIEMQLECLYDYVELKSISKSKKIKHSVRWCGDHETDMDRFTFVADGNEVEINFHSDFSVTRSGFELHWKTVDITGCPTQTLTAREGTIMSPNYPNFLLPNLDCSITILAPTGKRIWLEFEDYDFGKNFMNESSQMVNKYNDEAVLEVRLARDSVVFQPYEIYNLLTEGTFVSNDEHLKITFRTQNHPEGIGFKANYKTVDMINEERTIVLNNSTFGYLLNLNYPDNPPAKVNFTQHFIAPLGYKIFLELYHVKLYDKECQDGNGALEVYDNYGDSNGTTWYLCYAPEGPDEVLNSLTTVAITSFLNSLHLRQKNGILGMQLNGTLRVHSDINYKTKILKYRNDVVESCFPNPCLNGGKCIANGDQKFCQCSGHFTGLFCALTQCDVNPCVFGSCELTPTNYKCHCKTGYTGYKCDQKRKPCEKNPCESRGKCLEKGNGFQCQCHAWWEGPRCEKRMTHIPFKPLSERMLHEPFWLGLMTVSVVMGVIGLFWCAKRHFPEKIEKLLAEESDRNRSTVSSLRSASVREQLAASGAAAVTVTPSPGQGVPRSLFGRLGIRKPSILSLTSPHASGYVPATARTFSLDDLLKPPPRRTPSPKKKRNNSTPTKKNAAEKKQILQQLISPAGNKQHSRKVSLGELLQLSEKNLKDSSQKAENTNETKETKFMINDANHSLSDPKLEKKVTFARLLNRVSAEMSSGSEMELGIMQTNRLGCAFARPSSTPPSPIVDIRSPNSTSSNQGSDSLTSSDLAIPTALSSSISDLLSSRRPVKLANGRQKPSSADSILAMFRNFSSSSAGVNLPSSLKVSPSTTPTASSPQDDIVGDDESSTSSIQTPVSFSSLCDSPVSHRQNQNTIEVPVLDPLSAHKSSSSGSNFLQPPTILLEIPSTINKCLSPIRELPTPLPSPIPSPALTPIMRRSTASSSVEDIDISDDRMSVELPNISVSCSELDEDDIHRTQDIAIDIQAEDGLILEEARSMQQRSPPPSTLFLNKPRPPPLGHTLSSKGPSAQPSTSQPLPLIIPTLIIQTPSPTHSKPSSLLLHGSPPPQRPGAQQGKQNRKMLKEFDKPTSLDLPCAPPLITITCNMSEVESESESSPAVKNTTHLTTTQGGMTYLSPFSMGSRGEHAASESNLSSSGYSSMASPGPSRCGSSNPLCPSEMEDPGPPGSGSRNSHPQTSRRSSPLLKTSTNNEECTESGDQQRGRSDSETLSDEPLLESNDEGIGTDHIDEKIEEGELKSAKELEVFIVQECDKPKTLLDVTCVVKKCNSVEDNINLSIPLSTTNSKNSLQLPSIVVQCDSVNSDKHLSPMSSRSESPLSDKTSGISRFSPQFYGRHKDNLPFTDSDGLYDFPSSDKVNVTSSTHQHRKSTGRKREKKLHRSCKTPSPTKAHPPNSMSYNLDIPGKESFYKIAAPRKPSPKRRARTTKVISTSSSSDSINSVNEVRLVSSSPSPETIRWSSPVDWPDVKGPKSAEASGEETGDDTKYGTLSKPEILPKHHQKISRLRAISHQIRFLRRLELSLKRRERAISPSDSFDSGEDDSPRATSPLLCPSKKIEIQKSNSIGLLQTAGSQCTTKNRRGKCRKSELLLPQEKSSWRRVTITRSNGHSD